MTTHDKPSIPAAYRVHDDPPPVWPMLGIAIIGGIAVWAAIIAWVLA